MRITAHALVACVFCASSPALANCVPPLGPALTWSDTQTDEVKTCLREEAERATNDPLSVLSERQSSTVISRIMIRTGLNRLTQGYVPELGEAVSSLIQSGYLSDEIQNGLTLRFDEFELLYQNSIGSSSPTFEDAVAVREAWRELEEYLSQAQSAGLTQDEEKLIAELRAQGAALSEMAVFAAVRGSQDRLEDAIDQGLISSSDDIKARIGSFEKRIIELINRDNSSETVKLEGQQRISEIGEYAALTAGLIQLGERTSAVSSEDARRAVTLTNGLAQIGTAIVAAKTGAGVFTAAGPYAMAISGLLTLSTLSGSQEQSANERIYGLLLQISDQINALQLAVDRGFIRVEETVLQSERRVMGRLAQILQQGDATLERVSNLEQEMRSFRTLYLFSARQDQINRMQQGLLAFAYNDEQCLISLGLDDGEIRRCLESYSDLLQRFWIEDNASYVGAGLLENRGILPLDDRLQLVLQEISALGGPSYDYIAIHGPMFQRLSNRLKVFFALNPSALSVPRGAELEQRVAGIEQALADQRSFLKSEAVRDFVSVGYKEAFDEVSELVATRAQVFELDRNLTIQDEVSITERDDRNLYASWSGRLKDYPTESNALYRKIRSITFSRVRPPSGGHFLSRAIDIRRPEIGQPLFNKLIDFQKIAEIREPTWQLLRGDASFGHTWVQPCNRESGYMAFPVSRDDLTTFIGEELTTTTLVSKSIVEVCYQSIAKPFDDNLSNDNTVSGMDIINSRFDSMGMIDPRIAQALLPYDVQHPAYCSTAPAYFQNTYVKFAEFPLSDWEKCHKNGRRQHIHHKLYTNAEQVISFNFQVKISLPGFRSGKKLFNFQYNLPNERFDKCFMAFDNNNRANRMSVLFPFRVRFPFAPTMPCTEISEAFRAGASGVREQIRTFLFNETTTALEEPNLKISYADAISIELERSFKRLRSSRDEVLFRESEIFDRLDAFSDLQRIINELQASEKSYAEPINMEEIRILVDYIYSAYEVDSTGSLQDLIARLGGSE